MKWKKLAFDLLPNYLHEKLENYYREGIIKKNQERNPNIHSFKFTSENIKNLQILLNRNELLKVLPSNSVVAEIGTYKGDFARDIINFSRPQLLHIIDSWASEQYPSQLKMQVEERFKDEINNGRVIISKGDSRDVGSSFPDNYFDWIYLDTDHSYDLTKSELEIYATKIKKGGFISGHDFCGGNWNAMVKYGVIEAVTEFCVQHNWEFIYLTFELAYFPSFAIRRISD